MRWRSRPVFIINRLSSALQTLQNEHLLSRLSDARSDAPQQPPTAKNWHRSIDPKFGVVVGICTHLGRILEFFPDPNAQSPATNWLGGNFCPCHGSKYDLAGRVFAGVPAPYNLPVPPYRLIDSTILIGENPPDTPWEFGSIAQI